MTSPLTRLQDALVSDNFAKVEPDVLRKSNLAAYAFQTQLPATLKECLEPAFVQATARHIRIRHDVHPLLSRWHDSGVRYLLFKGFHLAEFVYEVPGGRFYSDIDVIIRAEDAELAECLADEGGWQNIWTRRSSVTPYSHEMFHLVSDSGYTGIDAHRFALQTLSPLVQTQRRVTEQVWERAKPVTWQGLNIYVPDPLDAVLVGLVLNRFWSPDNWMLRFHDYLDFKKLIELYALTPEALAERARELGCSKTLEIFLTRCNPYEGRLNLSRPTFLERNLWALQITPERGYVYLEDFVMRRAARPLLKRFLS